jgi:hypothetical protein
LLWPGDAAAIRGDEKKQLGGIESPSVEHGNGMSLADFKYSAFISYSHRDEKWASWLHNAVETYRVPNALVGQATRSGPVPARLSPVFRDRDELASATDLGQVLTQALRDSAYQIVICSPAAARSRWVNEEILTFKRLGRAERVLCLLVAGEPNGGNDEAFPEAVRFQLADDGRPSSDGAVPIVVDVRPGRDSKPSARLKIVASLLGLPFDVLRQREQARRHRRLMAVAAAAACGMAVTSVLAATAWFARLEADAQRERAEAEAETARQTTQFMVDLFAISDPSESLGNSITAREILDQGARRIETELVDRPDVQASLMDTMGTAYSSLGLYAPAVSLLERSVQVRTELFGPGHADVASSRNLLDEVRAHEAAAPARE